MALTPVEQTQYRYFLRAVLYDVQEAYLLYREGRPDNDYWNTRSALLHVYMGQESASEVYEQIKSLGLLHSDFAARIDQNIHR